MFSFDKKRLTLSVEDYNQVKEKLSDLLESKKAEITDENFLLAGATSVFIKKYRVDRGTLSIATSDDDRVTIVGSKEIVGDIKSLLESQRGNHRR